LTLLRKSRWTFYEAQGRYFVIYGIPRPPPGQPPRIRLDNAQTAWIFDKDLNLLVRFGI
jgi:hypothetical protein